MNNHQRNIIIYAAPFAVWIVLQSVLPQTAWAYALRSFAAAAVGLVSWRFIRKTQVLAANPIPAAVRLYQMSAALVLGLLVCALWILPDKLEWYRQWCCWPIGKLPQLATAPSPYAPDVCSWPLTIIKLLGSAFVIAPIEELFFRSFLYRWLQARDFTGVKLSHFDLSAFLWMVFLFTLEHDRPLAAVMAGGAYGFAAIRWGLGAAIIAHVTTNFALALHVIYWGEWSFW